MVYTVTFRLKQAVKKVKLFAVLDSERTVLTFHEIPRKNKRSKTF